MAVGGLELVMKFTEEEDRERIINKSRSVGWSPLPGMEWDDDKLFVSKIPRSSKASSNNAVEIHLNVRKAWIPLSLLKRVGAPENLRKDIVAYSRYKFFDKSM